jgi:hypothetical protein
MPGQTVVTREDSFYSSETSLIPQNVLFRAFQVFQAKPSPHLSPSGKHCWYFHSVLRGYLLTMKGSSSQLKNFSDLECSVAVLYTQLNPQGKAFSE